MSIDPRLAFYTIYFYDHSGTRVLLLTQYEYFEFSQRLNDSWNHIIRMEFSPEDERLDFFRNDLVRDYILEAYRIDPITEVKTLVYEGFHRTLVDQITMSGVVVLTMYGTGYTQLMKRRIVIPAVGEESSTKSGPAETVIKDFVQEQAVTPTDATRTITGLSIETDAGAGDTAEYSARYTNLFTVLERSAEQGVVDFGVTRNTDVGTFILQVRELWGRDRRVDNVDSNPPTIFDVTLNNMLIPILSRRGTDEVNHVYVGGQGQGIDRVIQEESNAAAEAITPWNRHEAFVDARNEETPDGLTTRGQAYLKEHRSTVELSFNIQQTEGTRWVRDWNMGDIITAKYGGITFTKKVVKVTVVVSSGDTGQAVIEVIDVNMEDVE